MKDNGDKVFKAYIQMKSRKMRIIDNNTRPPGLVKARLFYPITKFMLLILHIFNSESITYLNDKTVKVPEGRPIIYACTHKFKPDMEKFTLSLKEPSFLLASDFKNSYRTISGWYFSTRPTIFVDPYDKYSYKLMVKYLQSGLSCMIFPEAVWNLSENRIVLGTFTGTVRAAIETNAIIICSAIERYDKNYIINRKGYIDIPEFINKLTSSTYNNLNEEAKKTIINECNCILRDTMASLTWDIWLNHATCKGITHRSELSKDFWEKYVLKLISEWKGYNMIDNIEQRRYIMDEKAQIDVEQLLESIPPTLNNAFLFNKRIHN